MLHKKRIIKVTSESVPGTHEAGATDVLTEDLVCRPTGPFEARSGGGLYLGHTTPGYVGENTGMASFTVELRSTAAITFTAAKMQYRELTPGERNGLMIHDVTAQLNNSSGNDWLTIAVGAGTLGSGIDLLLKACGFALNSTTYSPHSVLGDQDTLSIDCWEDGKKKTLAGCQGKMTVEFETGKRVLLKFEFSGVAYTESDEALPAFAPGTTAVLRAAGGAFTLATAKKKISRLTLDCGQNVIPRHDVNAASGVAYYSITDFDPTVSFDLESELVATYNIHGIWRAHTEGAMVFTAA